MSESYQPDIIGTPERGFELNSNERSLTARGIGACAMCPLTTGRTHHSAYELYGVDGVDGVSHDPGKIVCLFTIKATGMDRKTASDQLREITQKCLDSCPYIDKTL